MSNDNILVIIGTIGIIWWFGNMFYGALRDKHEEGTVEGNRKIREERDRYGFRNGPDL